MVGSRRAEEVVDPKISEKPSSKALKRALLVALRCVDPDSIKRPKMGHVIHMLEADDLLFREVCFFSFSNIKMYFNEPKCVYLFSLVKQTKLILEV